MWLVALLVGVEYNVRVTSIELTMQSLVDLHLVKVLHAPHLDLSGGIIDHVGCDFCALFEHSSDIDVDLLLDWGRSTTREVDSARRIPLSESTLEGTILGLFRHTANWSPVWQTVLLEEVGTVLHRLFAFVLGSTLTNPHVHDATGMKHEAVVGIEHIASQSTFGDLSHFHGTTSIADAVQTVWMGSRLDLVIGTTFLGRLDRGWIATKSSEESL
mmetsp:Transcript_17474/g.31591  ORF Transcript_17474/g.31591 Transcript_17474/m.31591 type:complete len:215 (+) Transcript_17474:297-941(+)